MKGISTEVKISALRVSETGGRNSQFASVCKNIHAGKGYVEGYEPDLQSLPLIQLGTGYLDVAVDWPFPQVFISDTGIYIGTRDGLYSISHTAGVWVATSLTPAITHAISWPWTFANVPLFPVFASGDLLVYYDYVLAEWINYNKLYTVECGSNWSASWEQPIATCLSRGQVFMVGATVGTGSPSQSRIVRWSEIGAFNFLGASATTRKNTAGEMFIPLNNDDICMRVLSLGDSVIVYSNFQITELQPVMKPTPSFAVTAVKNIGINNPLAVGGHEKEHLFVDRTGALYTHSYTKNGADRGIGIKYVGYEEFLLPLIDTTDTTIENSISIVYNEPADEYYISNGRVSYLYKDGGLTEMCSCITSMFDLSNTNIISQTDIVALGNKPTAISSTIANNGFYYESDVLDFKLLAIKVLEGIDILGDIGEAGIFEVMVKWRNNKREEFNETNWKRVSPEGFCAPLVAGVEFIICMRAYPGTGIVINSLVAKWKITDKRFIRGRYDTSNAS